ncbi:hypothetical protein [Corallococcus sp. CA053C]|uniref:hypothetical protein n=1 Tax=Corallococcus sp. CA053C TaxID=2316732 RepID=UPI001315887B|nr:hypothetical protein [Corallococcus sp. CA053C]
MASRIVIPPPQAEPHLYTDLAPWWPLFSPPEEYVEERDRWNRDVIIGVREPRGG